MLTHSDTIGAIAKAMAAAQTELKNVLKDSENPFFRSNYAAWDSILDVIRPIYSKHGVAMLQAAEGLDAENRVSVETMMIHAESGEWLKSRITVPLAPGKVDPQVIGSATTYACRYAGAAMALVAGTKDDDGESSSGRPATPGKPVDAPKPKPTKAKPEPAPVPATPVWFPEETDRFNGLMTETKGYMHVMNLFDEYEELLDAATKAKASYGPEKLMAHAEAKRDKAKADAEAFLSREV